MSKVEHYSNFKWIKVKRYQADPNLNPEENLQKFEEHHVEETNFLIDEIRRLAKEYDELAARCNEKS